MICGGGVKSRTPMLMRAGRGVRGAEGRGGGGATVIETKVENGGAVERKRGGGVRRGVRGNEMVAAPNLRDCEGGWGSRRKRERASLLS